MSLRVSSGHVKETSCHRCQRFGVSFDEQEPAAFAIYTIIFSSLMRRIRRCNRLVSNWKKVFLCAGARNCDWKTMFTFVMLHNLNKIKLRSSQRSASLILLWLKSIDGLIRGFNFNINFADCFIDVNSFSIDL